MNINKTMLDQALSENCEKDFFLWDSKLTGFGVKIKTNGKASYIYDYRNQFKQRRRITIGNYPPMTMQQAKAAYSGLYVKVKGGIDPIQEKQAIQHAQTVTDLCIAYIKAMDAGYILHRGKSKTPHTIKTDKGRINRHIIPLIGKHPLDDLKRITIEKMMHDIIQGKTAQTEKTGYRGLSIVKGGAGVARAAVVLLGAIWNWGIKQGLVDESLRNPCSGIEKPASVKRDRILSLSEINRFGQCLTKLEGDNMHPLNPFAGAAIKFLFLSGWRLGEVLTLKQSFLDYENHYVNLPHTKTGKQRRPLGLKAWDLLQQLHPNIEGFLFWGASPNKSLAELKQFKRVTSHAGIADFRIHDIRHCFASLGAELGYADSTIGGLIGHSGQSITSRYITRQDPALITAADHISTAMMERLGL